MAARTDDQSVAQRVLDHVAAGTTDTGAEVWREPVANYRSGSRLAAELALLRRTPVPFCPSAALPQKGSYVARDAAGVPLLAVRGADGKVRAFRNACRHRGTQLASGSGCAKAFVCPYHAWTYTLEGKLRHVPHEEGFPGLDKSAHGLVPVHAEERLGLVFIVQDPSCKYFNGFAAGAAQAGPAGLRRQRARARGQLESLPRRLHRGLPHPLHPSAELLSLRLRQFEPHRPVRPRQPHHLSVPAHRETGRPCRRPSAGSKAC